MDTTGARDGRPPRPTTIPEVLARRAEERPERPAVVDDGGTLTYGALLEAAHDGARRLLGAGLAPGDRVALQMANGRDWLVAYWSGALAALVVVPIDIRSRPSEVEAMVERCGARLLVAGPDAGLADQLGAARVARGLEAVGPADGWPSGRPLPGLDGRATPGDVHLLQLTSGSTGLPKAAMLTHRGLLANAAALGEAWGLATGESIVVPGPFSHILGFLTGCLVPAVVGATVLTMSAFTPERALELIERHRAVAVAGTPTHHLMLVEHPARAQRDCSSLRFLMYGGAPMTREVARRITEGLGVAWLLGGFGMSETSGGVTSVVPGDPLDVQLDSVGRPLPTFEVRVVDPSTGTPCPPGARGELWVRGEPVCLGYWGDPDESGRAVTPDGWLRTGDLVIERADGALSFAGRLKEIILVGGYTVTPGEIERVLSAHAAVAEAVVVGAPEPRLGEIPVAFVRLAAGASVSAAALEAHCRAALASYKAPRHYVFVDTFPLSPTGKVQRRSLGDEAALVVSTALSARTGAG
ncbi:MAG: class I adenylate-forming enzyme family protein [Actinomycetota bacterium]|nr:class I adenylate-forming enzyme family protein [Actinomycetota bacterium]